MHLAGNACAKQFTPDDCTRLKKSAGPGVEDQKVSNKSERSEIDSCAHGLRRNPVAGAGGSGDGSVASHAHRLRGGAGYPARGRIVADSCRPVAVAAATHRTLQLATVFSYFDSVLSTGAASVGASIRSSNCATPRRGSGETCWDWTRVPEVRTLREKLKLLCAEAGQAARSTQPWPRSGWLDTGGCRSSQNHQRPR